MEKLPLRSPFAKVNGFVYFGRMLDKIRVHAKGGLPEDYRANLGKGFDESCVKFLRVDYNDLTDRVREGGSDQDDQDDDNRCDPASSGGGLPHALLRQRVDSLGQSEIEFRQAALAVSGEEKPHLVIADINVRVMFFFFSHFRDRVHEINRIREV